MRRLLGLDLSLTACGIAWTHDANGRPAPGCRTVTSEDDGQARIWEIRCWVSQACAGQPELAVIESLFVENNVTTLALAELHGVIKQDLWRRRIPYVLVAPSTLKKYATGNGGAEKAEVLHSMRHRYGHLFGSPSAIATTDEADAVAAMALGGHALGDPPAPVPTANAKAVDTIRPKVNKLLASSAGAALLRAIQSRQEAR